MKTGKEIRSPALTHNVTTTKYLWRGALIVAVLLNILFLPLNVSISVLPAAADAATDPLSQLVSDGDPAHLGQVESMVKAVQSGSDTDPVHIQEVQEYLSDQAASAAAETPAPPQSSPPQPASQSTNVPSSQPAQSVTTLQIGNNSVNVSSLNIASTQPVTVTLYDSSGAAVATGQLQPTNTSNSSTPQASPAPVATVDQASGLYVDPNTDVAQSGIAALAGQPVAAWFGDWDNDIQSAVNNYVTDASQAGKVALLVAYNIPDRDCGGYSAGGAQTQSDYINWIGNFARGIGNRTADVILEPDAVAGLDCLSSSDQAAREQMLSSAVSILKSNPNTKVYIDAGNPTWQSAQTIATRLEASGINEADGFSLNVSNFQTTAANISYGEAISAQIGGKHFVIDTSRNGNGSNGQTCNPAGAHIGNDPTTNTGNSLVDAFLWVKVPGESDGSCNGGPAAGTWWQQYALSLVK